MSLCKQCNKWVTQTPGRRKKEFCNNTCRSNYWYKLNKKDGSEDELKSKIDYIATVPKMFDFEKKPDNYFLDEPPIYRSFSRGGFEEKSFQQHMNEMAAFEFPAEYENKAKEVESSTNLTNNEKKILLLNLKAAKL